MMNRIVAPQPGEPVRTDIVLAQTRIRDVDLVEGDGPGIAQDVGAYRSVHVSILFSAGRDTRRQPDVTAVPASSSKISSSGSPSHTTTGSAACCSTNGRKSRMSSRADNRA